MRAGLGTQTPQCTTQTPQCTTQTPQCTTQTSPCAHSSGSRPFAAKRLPPWPHSAGSPGVKGSSPALGVHHGGCSHYHGANEHVPAPASLMWTGWVVACP